MCTDSKYESHCCCKGCVSRLYSTGDGTRRKLLSPFLSCSFFGELYHMPSPWFSWGKLICSTAVTPFWSTGPGQDERLTWPQHFCQVPVCLCSSLRMRQKQSLRLTSCQSQVFSNSLSVTCLGRAQRQPCFPRLILSGPEWKRQANPWPDCQRCQGITQWLRWQGTYGGQLVQSLCSVGSPRTGCPRPSDLLSLFLVGSVGA